MRLLICEQLGDMLFPNGSHPLNLFSPPTVAHVLGL